MPVLQFSSFYSFGLTFNCQFFQFYSIHLGLCLAASSNKAQFIQQIQSLWSPYHKESCFHSKSIFFTFFFPISFLPLLILSLTALSIFFSHFLHYPFIAPVLSAFLFFFSLLFLFFTNAEMCNMQYANAMIDLTNALCNHCALTCY